MSSQISIHALLAESDFTTTITIFIALKFLSTLSLRRATAPRVATLLEVLFLSTLSLRRATQDKRRQHHERGFLSTLSLRRATQIENALRQIVDNFYPRSPCGERLTTTITIFIVLKFLSTLSLRRATWLRCWQLAARDISIHALLAESDSSQWMYHNTKF